LELVELRNGLSNDGLEANDDEGKVGLGVAKSIAVKNVHKIYAQNKIPRNKPFEIITLQITPHQKTMNKNK